MQFGLAQTARPIWSMDRLLIDPGHDQQSQQGAIISATFRAEMGRAGSATSSTATGPSLWKNACDNPADKRNRADQHGVADIALDE